MASVSATDLNTTDEIVSDSMGDVVSIDNSDDVISIGDTDDLNIVESNLDDDLSVSNDSEILTRTFTVSKGNFWGDIQNANPGDTIIVDGAYEIKTSVSIDKQLNFVGINDALLDVYGDTNTRMFSINADGVTFKNIAFKNGHPYKESGGAIFCNGNNLVVDNCQFINCFCNYGGSGGAIFLKGCVNSTIINSVFTDCASQCGGAIYGDLVGNLKLKNNTFSGCWVTDYHGGAIQISGTSDVSIIEDCNFINCHSGDYGGAINSDMGSKTFFEGLKILNCKFIGCYCLNGRGGAVDCDSPLNLNISGCYFDSCYSVNDMGGAIRLSTANTAVISNSKFVNCYADKGNGGAIHLTNLRGDNYNVIIDNCDFENNHVSGYGADIDAYHTHNLKVLNCNFINSESTDLQGGSIFIRICSDINISASCFESSKSKHSGGSIAIDTTDNVKLDELTFNNCSGLYGGSIFITSVSNFALTNSNFTNSKASESGGAIHVNPATDVNITGCSFTNCSALDRAGSMDIAFTDYILIDKCNIEHSTSTAYDGDSIVFSGPSKSCVVSDTIFDVNPKNINYHINSKLDVNNLSIVKGDDAIITAELSIFSGPLSNKEVTFTVNNKKYPALTSSRGIVTFDVKNYFPDWGSYVVGVSYDGEGAIKPISKNVTVVINEYKGMLTVTQDGDYYGEKTLTFKLVDRDGNPVCDRIIVVFPDSSVPIKTDSNGLFTYFMDKFAPGNYNVSAYVDNVYVDVNKVDVNVAISKISGNIELSTSNSNKTLYVKLVNKTTNHTFSGIDVKLQFNPNGYQTSITTDATGSKSFSMADFKPETYSVIASVDSSGFKEFATVELGNIVISSIGKEDSSIVFRNNIVFNYGASGSTTFELEGCTVSRENIKVVGQEGKASITLKDNRITVSDLPAGTYTLRVTSTPDEYHNAVTRDVGITVNKIDSSININPVTCNYGDSATITATMNGCGISYTSVSVEGQNPTINVVNNVITVSGLPVGTHNLKVITIPDNNHESVTKTTTITVKPVNSAIGFDNPMSFVYGTVGSISLKLDGCSIVEEGCTIVGHKEAVIDVNKNVVKVSNLSANQYTLRISSSPDSNHNAVTQDIVVTVTKADSNVDLAPKPITFDYGTTGTANLILDGCTVLSDDVIVEGYDAAITRVANDILYVSNLPANTYTLQIKTTPDDNHRSVTKKFTVTVNKPLSTVEFIGSADFDYLGVGRTTLKLTGCTVGLDDIEVVGYDAAISIGKGNIVSISELDSGRYTLKVKTTPDSNHLANTATLEFTVNKVDSKISFTKDVISFKYAKSGSVVLTLDGCSVDVNKISVVGKKAKITLKGNVLTVSGLPVGTYTLKVVTIPNKHYNSVTKSIKVKVSKNTAKISVEAKTVAVKKATNWAVTLKDSSGKPISKAKVLLKVYTGKKFKPVTATTNAKGVANYNTKSLGLGTHKIVVSFSHKGYTCKAVTSSVKVIKPRALVFEVNPEKLSGGGASLTVLVKDKATKKYVNGVKVNFLIKTGSQVKKVQLISGKYKGQNAVVAYATNMLSKGKHAVQIVTADVKYTGSNSTSMVIKKSVKNGWYLQISKGKKITYGIVPI